MMISSLGLIGTRNRGLDGTLGHMARYTPGNHLVDLSTYIMLIKVLLEYLVLLIPKRLGFLYLLLIIMSLRRLLGMLSLLPLKRKPSCNVKWAKSNNVFFPTLIFEREDERFKKFNLLSMFSIQLVVAIII